MVAHTPASTFLGSTPRRGKAALQVRIMIDEGEAALLADIRLRCVVWIHGHRRAIRFRLRNLRARCSSISSCAAGRFTIRYRK